MELTELKDKIIEKFEISDDQSVLRISTNNGIYDLIACGDCCSESWFADIFNAKDAIGEKILYIKEIDLDYIPQNILFPYINDGRGRQEYDLVYSILIITVNTRVEIIFRNSSNGYYGGYALLEESSTNNDLNFKEIVINDWSA